VEIQKEIDEKDRTIINLVTELHKAEKMLQDLIDEGKAKLQVFEEAGKGYPLQRLILILIRSG